MALSVKGCGGGGSGSGDCTATKAYVLAGKTAITSDSDDEPIEGTMANRGAVSTSIGVGGSYTIPAGYHNGSGKVTGPTLSGNAAVANVLTGKTFYSNSGTKQTGTMANNGAVSKSLSINGTYTIPAGYHNGSGKVTQSITSKAAATYTPGTSNQTIAAGQYLSGAQTIKGDSNLVAANILKGKSIFGVSGTAIKLGSVTTETTSSSSKREFTTAAGGARNLYYVSYGTVGFTPSHAHACSSTASNNYNVCVASIGSGESCGCRLISVDGDPCMQRTYGVLNGCVLTSSSTILPLSTSYGSRWTALQIIGYY